MLGYSETELLKMSCDKFVSADDEQSNERALFQELKSGLRDSYRIEKACLRKDGTRMWGRVHVCKLNTKENDAPMVLAMVEDITDQKRAEQRLNDTQITLREMTGRLIYAQEEERRRIARELHDDIGQRLSLLMVEMEQINRVISAASGTHVSTLGRVLREVDELTRDVHELSHQLHSTKLSYVGLNAALKELCEQVASQQRIAITQHVEGDGDLSFDIQLCFYRVAQEALKNIAKHSHASRATINFQANHGVARLEIADNGIGFDPASPAVGLGLASMSERVRTVNGEFAVTSNSGKGTRVVAVVPYDSGRTLTRAA
jgi:PAS domain S-box-containing protein